MNSAPIITVTVNPAVDVTSSIERIVPVHKLRCGPARHDPGGGGINVARAVTRLGGDALAIFPAGGPMGRLLAELVRGEGLKSDIIEIAEDTREDFTIDEVASSQQFRFVLPGPMLSKIEQQTLFDSVGARVLPGSYVVASGSLPPGVDPDFYARLARSVSGKAGRFVLDSSGAALKTALGAGLFLIKPSLGELSELIGKKLVDRGACVDACRELVREGAATYVAVTRGPEGALLVSENIALSARPPRIEARSTVGAGDCFLGALVWALARDSKIEECLRYAVAAGSAALFSVGTGLFRKDDVERLLPQVELERL